MTSLKKVAARYSVPFEVSDEDMAKAQTAIRNAHLVVFEGRLLAKFVGLSQKPDQKALQQSLNNMARQMYQASFPTSALHPLIWQAAKTASGQRS